MEGFQKIKDLPEVEILLGKKITALMRGTIEIIHGKCISIKSGKSITIINSRRNKKMTLGAGTRIRFFD